MPFKLNTDRLFDPVRPNAITQGFAGIGDAIDAIIERRHKMEMQANQIAAQKEMEQMRQAADTSQFEAKMRAQAEAERRKAAIDAEQEQRKNRAAMSEKVANMYAEGKGQFAPMVARGYGGDVVDRKSQMEQLYSGARERGEGSVWDPTTRTFQQVPPQQQYNEGEDDGASYIGENQAYADAQKATAGGGQVLTYPGMDPLEFSMPPDPKEEARQQAEAMQGLQPPGHQDVQRSILEGQAMGLSGKELAAHVRAAHAQVGAMDRARIVKPSQMATMGNQRADNIRGDITSLRGAYRDWETTSANVDQLVQDRDKMRSMQANVQAYSKNKSNMSVRAGLYAAARYITGPGVLTDQEYSNTVSNTSGLFASAMTKLKKGADGSISAAEADELAKFVSLANREIKRRAERALEDFDSRFTNSYYAGQPGSREEIGQYRKAFQKRFGIVDRKEAMERAKANANARKGITP